MNDQVLTKWIESGKCASLRALDLDASDNVSEDMLLSFIEKYVSLRFLKEKKIFKGSVQRDGSGRNKLGAFDRSSLKREARRFFGKIRPPPIP